jgi:hypothetical protein
MTGISKINIKGKRESNHWEACIGKQEQGVWHSIVWKVNQILTSRCCGVYAIGVTAAIC